MCKSLQWKISDRYNQKRYHGSPLRIVKQLQIDLDGLQYASNEWIRKFFTNKKNVP